MAVIKESRQFKIGPVGVARASDTRQTSRALSEALSAVGKIQYDRAARNALKVGEEAGQSAIVIDPETGLPQPLIPPKGFGSIASDAYDRVARNRFEFSIQNEIEVKGQELAAKYMNNRNGSALYHQTMSDYIESMTEAADGAGYKSYIADTGTAYRDLTTQKLALAQQERERSEMIEFTQTAFTKGSNSVEALAASNPDEAAIIAEQSLQGVKNAVASDLLPKSAIQSAKTELMIAKAKGVLRGLGPDVDPEDLAKIEFAFDTANKDLLPAGYLHLAPLISDFGNDFKSIETVANFATEHLRPIAILSTENVRKQEEIIAKEQSQSTLSLLNDRYSVGIKTGRSITDTFDSSSEVRTSIAVNSAIKRANEFQRNANAAFLDSESNPANLELYKQFTQTALTVRSAAAQAIILGNRKKDSRFLPEDIKGIIQFLDTGDRFNIEGLDTKTTSVVEMLSKVIKDDNTGEVKKGSLLLLEQIMDAGDIEEAVHIELGDGEVAAIEAAAFEAELGKGIEIANILLLSIKESEDFIKGAQEAGLNDTADAQIQKINETIIATVDGTIDRSLVGLNTTEASALLNAIANKDPSLAPNKTSAEAIQMLINLQSVYPKSGDSTIWTKADSATKSYRNGAAKAINAQQTLKRLDREDSAQHLLAGMNIPAIDFGTGKDSIISVFARENSKIINIPSITKEDAEKGQDALRAAATKAVFQRLLATDLTEDQTNQVVGYFNDSNTTLTNLTTSQKILIKEMSNYSNSVLDKSLTKSLQSDFKGALAEVKLKLAKDEVKEKQRLDDIRLMGGGGDLTLKSDRVGMNRVETALGIKPREFNSMTPEQQGITLSLYESTPSDNLLTGLERMAMGLPVKGADSLLNIFSLMSNGLSETATAGVDYFGSTLTDETKELLSDAFDIIKNGEGESAQEVIGNLIAGYNSSQHKSNLNIVLDGVGSSTAFAINVVDDPFVGVELAPIVTYLGLTGKSKEQITDRLKAIVDQKYPVSPNIVDPSRPINNKGRSRFGLMKTIEDEKIRSKFIEIIDSQVIELSAKMNAIDKDFPQIKWAPTLGTNERKVYLKPDNTGASLHYFAYYGDENNELVPFTYYTDVSGNVVKEGTKGSKKEWVSYSIQNEVGEDLLKLEKEKKTKLDLKIKQNERQQQLQFDTSKMSPAEFAAFQQERMNRQFQNGGLLD